MNNIIINTFIINREKGFVISNMQEALKNVVHYKKELLKDILNQLENNNYICPCSLRADPNRDKCMCEEFRDVINNNIEGVYTCNCGRFIATITQD
jgi:hypothetical protein